MERSVLYRDDQEVQAADLNNMQAWTTKSIDDIVFDAIDPGIRYTGFPTVQVTTTKVNVGAGRLYFQGDVYWRNDSGGVDIDLLQYLPITTQKIVTITAWTQDLQTDTQARDFLINADTGETEPSAVPMEDRRQANLTPVPGIESPVPVGPAIDAAALAIADVLLGPTGIVSIVMHTENLLLSSRSIADRVTLLEIWKLLAGSELETLASDIARLAQELLTKADAQSLVRTQVDVAHLKNLEHLPESYIDYGADYFLDTTETDQTVTGYAAKINEGVSFPDAANATIPMALLNPADSRVMVSNNLVLPTYKLSDVRLIAGLAYEVALNQFAFQAQTIVKATVRPVRTILGPAQIVSASSSFWGTGTWIDVSRGIFESRAGVTYQALPTGLTDSNGVALLRVYAKSSSAFSGQGYWTRSFTNETYSGTQWGQTFLNGQDQWVIGLGLHFTVIDTRSSVTVMLCQTKDGQPDTNFVMATVTVTGASLQSYQNQANSTNTDFPGASSSFNNFAIKPTFLQSGEQYAVVVMTGGNFTLAATTNQQYSDGTLFYRLVPDGYWLADPSHQFMLDLNTCAWQQQQSTIELASLALAGGIATLDMYYEAVVPKQTQLIFEVQLNGNWYNLMDVETNPLVGLPLLLPFRMRFIGNSSVQPGLQINDSNVIASRPNNAMKHGSTLRTLAAPVTNAELILTLKNFDPAHHTCSPKLLLGAVESAPTVVSDRIVDNFTTVRTSTFTFGTPQSSYKRIFYGTTDTVTDLFLIQDATDVAIS